MTYAQDRFYHTRIQHRGADGQVRKMEQFTYESYGTLYDILVFQGTQFVRVNCGPLSNVISDWKPAHYAISDHFKLTEKSMEIKNEGSTQRA